jgi:hypothetical protein
LFGGVRFELPGIGKPCVFGVAPGTGKVAIMKPQKQTVYPGTISLALDGFEVFGYKVGITIKSHG